MDEAWGRVVGYCTNVHAGESLEQTRDNLQRYAVAVRERVCPDGVLGIGLWLSARAAAELCQGDATARFADWLAERQLDVFTINGFPYGDFHRDIVKHDVYRPDWRTAERLEYTVNLATILASLVPDGGEGSISTLPIGWGVWLPGDDDQAAAATQLRRVARTLAQIHEQTGRTIHLDIEPEPGCLLQTSGDVVRFFQRHLLVGDDEDRCRHHLRVCHDVCHAAVMFERQAAMFAAYDEIGVAIGKVQVSSAVVAPFAELDDARTLAALKQLGELREPRYLHQTVVEPAGPGGDRLFFDDLPDAIASVPSGHDPGRQWRVHFHVPIDIDAFGLLKTTQAEIETCLDLLATRPEVRHYEVETYAWDVLPEELQVADLSEGIARELMWFNERLKRATKRLSD